MCRGLGEEDAVTLVSGPTMLRVVCGICTPILMFSFPVITMLGHARPLMHYLCLYA